ncbi:hypothetical protein AM493_11050 [Flavobacterium akiainvivens]|uniref:Uncharacterized protein n=1 Tax=Flavobacterium akiainvivens TaxID=1202724 RepID=A0A0M8MHS8_9FLAO|nr:hypothetical protein [Flavobacterium akiainvivens]KOS06511.1 hypothetical protein AM493_11050 [Flavobacterium akiainvivens]SFQ11744.1 hypothetical protein SAMN05444144_101150 [Flavobacterium akiainvivens]
MNKLLLLLLLAGTLCNAQQTFKVVDSLTHEPLPYINVNLLNGYGVYTDAGGNVQLHDIGVTQIELSGIGYATKKVILSEVKGEILLAPQPIVLDEVTIPVGKPEIKKVKAKGHQNESEMAVSRFGMEYAVFIPGAETEAYITALSLPLMEKHFAVNPDYKSLFHKTPYKTFVKVEFLPVVNNVPGEERLYDFEDVMLVDGTQSPKLFDYELSQQIELPKEGLFVKLTILGRADENGGLINELPYDIVTDAQGVEARRMKQLQPNFPLTEIKKQQVPAYTHIMFSANKNWNVIDRPLVFDPSEVYNGFTINIGYTLKTYK